MGQTLFQITNKTDEFPTLLPTNLLCEVLLCHIAIFGEVWMARGPVEFFQLGGNLMFLFICLFSYFLLLCLNKFSTLIFFLI